MKEIGILFILNWYSVRFWPPGLGHTGPQTCRLFHRCALDSHHLFHSPCKHLYYSLFASEEKKFQCLSWSVRVVSKSNTNLDEICEADMQKSDFILSVLQSSERNDGWCDNSVTHNCNGMVFEWIICLMIETVLRVSYLLGVGYEDFERLCNCLFKSSLTLNMNDFSTDW